MPNWCDNNTEIVFKSEVKQEEIKEFVDKLVVIDRKDNEKVINLRELIPLQENGEWNYDLAVKKWGSKWEPVVDSMDYDEKYRTLYLHYLSAWSPISESFETIYKNHSNLIKSISTKFEEPGMGFYGDFYVDENGADEMSYDLPNVSYIEEDDLKKLYELIKFKNAEIELPRQVIDDMRESSSYINFLERTTSNNYNDSFEDNSDDIEFDENDYDFEVLWEDYIYDGELDRELIELMKKHDNINFDDYVKMQIEKFTK